MYELVTCTDTTTGQTLHREIISGDPDGWVALRRSIRARVARDHGLPVESVAIDSVYTTATTLDELDGTKAA